MMGRLMGPDIAEPTVTQFAGVEGHTAGLPGPGVQRNTDAPPARYLDTPPLTAADVVTAMTQVLAEQQPAKAEPPIEPAGWSPFQVAALRGAIGALAVGSAVFFPVFSHTNDVKTLVVATIPAVISYIAIRVGVEGTYDAARFERTRQ